LGKTSVLKLQGCKFLINTWSNLCSENGIDYSLEYGTLLGWYRNKKIISYDGDCDIWIDNNSIDKIIKIVIFTNNLNKIHLIIMIIIHITIN